MTEKGAEEQVLAMERLRLTFTFSLSLWTFIWRTWMEWGCQIKKSNRILQFNCFSVSDAD